MFTTDTMIDVLGKLVENADGVVFSNGSSQYVVSPADDEVHGHVERIIQLLHAQREWGRCFRSK